jgi:hypothetical protein
VVAVTAAVAGLSREAPTVVISELQVTALAIERAYAGEVKFSCSLDQWRVVDQLPDKRDSANRTPEIVR